MFSQGSPLQITFATVFQFVLHYESNSQVDCFYIQYLFVLSEENMLPVHVIPARFVRQVAYISQFLFFKLSYKCRVKFREKFLVFHKWCFTTAAFSSLFEAEEEHL